MKTYEYIIVGSGISGSSVAYELSKYSDDILLIDKLEGVACGASGAAGAFLSPLLGKPNYFKELVTKALQYTTKLYKTNFFNVIDNCGTVRIPKNSEDEQKFQSYIPYIDFYYEKKDNGYYFPIASVVNSLGICKMMTSSFTNNKIRTLFNYNVTDIEYKDNIWYLNNQLKAKNLILTTGASIELLNEPYINIRAVWGRRIDVETTTKLDYNYHKECSVSKSFPIGDGKYKISIGATHKRDIKDIKDIDQNRCELLKKAADIVNLENIKIVKDYIGARASSVDYLPIIGEIIDSKQTLKEFPYLQDGTHVEEKRFTRYKNLFILNGVGGRGFVLAPYLAKLLVENIINKTPIDIKLQTNRLFLRYAKRKKNLKK